MHKHEFTSAQLAYKAPLLLPCDLGMGIGELMVEGLPWLREKKREMDPEDEDILL